MRDSRIAVTTTSRVASSPCIAAIATDVDPGDREPAESKPAAQPACARAGRGARWQARAHRSSGLPLGAHRRIAEHLDPAHQGIDGRTAAGCGYLRQPAE